MKWNKNKKCDRPNKTRGNKPKTKINAKAKKKYPEITEDVLLCNT